MVNDHWSCCRQIGPRTVGAQLSGGPIVRLEKVDSLAPERDYPINKKITKLDLSKLCMVEGSQEKSFFASLSSLDFYPRYIYILLAYLSPLLLHPRCIFIHDCSSQKF